MAAQVTFKGKPLTLSGDTKQVGDKAGDFSVLAGDLSESRFSEIARGKVCILVSVPSLDTPVCDTETRWFNQEAAKLGDDVVVVTISMDLPFAQSRWCGAAGIDRVKVFSDFRDRQFAKEYGLLIQELGLLARAVFVVDRDGVIQYKQLVKEVAEEPDYEPILQAVKKLV